MLGDYVLVNVVCKKTAQFCTFSLILYIFVLHSRVLHMNMALPNALAHFFMSISTDSDEVIESNYCEMEISFLNATNFTQFKNNFCG